MTGVNYFFFVLRMLYTKKRHKVIHFCLLNGETFVKWSEVRV